MLAYRVVSDANRTLVPRSLGRYVNPKKVIIPVVFRRDGFGFPLHFHPLGVEFLYRGKQTDQLLRFIDVYCERETPIVAEVGGSRGLAEGLGGTKDAEDPSSNARFVRYKHMHSRIRKFTNLATGSLRHSRPTRGDYGGLRTCSRVQ